MEDYRYVGVHGRGHHPAYCSGIGEIYYGQIVSLDEEQVKNLPKSEWVKVGNFCRHMDMDGNLCWGDKDNDSPYCSAHREEYRLRAQLTKSEEPEQEELDQLPEEEQLNLE